MEIVQDRGVLRGSRAGAFAIGGYSGASDDIVVGADSGAAAGDEEGEEEEEDEEVDWEELEEGAEGSDDELGVMDDLQSLPSLLFREERRKDEERKKELQDFWEHESRSRGQTETPQREEGDAVAHGNVRLATPVVAGDEDDLDLFTAPEARPRAVTAPLATPSRSPVASTSKLPASTTAALRKMVQATTLSSSPSPHSSSSPSVKCTLQRKAKPPSTSRREVSVSPSSSRAQCKPVRSTFILLFPSAALTLLLPPAIQVVASQKRHHHPISLTFARIGRIAASSRHLSRTRRLRTSPSRRRNLPAPHSHSHATSLSRTVSTSATSSNRATGKAREASDPVLRTHLRETGQGQEANACQAR